MIKLVKTRIYFSDFKGNTIRYKRVSYRSEFRIKRTFDISRDRPGEALKRGSKTDFLEKDIVPLTGLLLP